MAVVERAPYELSAESLAASLESNIAQRTTILREEAGLVPYLAVMCDSLEDNSPANVYVDLKRRVGDRLGVMVMPETIFAPQLRRRITRHNTCPDVHAMMVQLPLESLALSTHESREDWLSATLNEINPVKDIDGQGINADYAPATATSIADIGEANGIVWSEQELVVIRGNGRTAGGPAAKVLKARGANVESIDINTPEELRRQLLTEATTIVSATGKGHDLTLGLFDVQKMKDPKVVFDIGKATSSNGEPKGDVAEDLRSYGITHGWKFTPTKRGVGLITVRNALLHAVDAAEKVAAAPNYRRKRPHQFSNYSWLNEPLRSQMQALAARR